MELLDVDAGQAVLNKKKEDPMTRTHSDRS